jgi:hypothetical protein
MGFLAGLVGWILVVVGALGLLLLDGQTFTHAVFGLICGAIAVVIGLSGDRPGEASTGRGRLRGVGLAGGLLLAVCLALLPSAYRQQQRFNSGLQAAVTRAANAARAANRAESPAARPEKSTQR